MKTSNIITAVIAATAISANVSAESINDAIANTAQASNFSVQVTEVNANPVSIQDYVENARVKDGQRTVVQGRVISDMSDVLGSPARL